MIILIDIAKLPFKRVVRIYTVRQSVSLELCQYSVITNFLDFCPFKR